eukprot:XP_001694076.1 predicted protein [Chlamydomonas reinhardtii]
MAARRGGRVRLLCLELVNLASNTAVMPRGLLTGAVWAVDVDLAGGSLLLVDNCTLVMSQEEFMWQSYYMAQVLASTVVGSGVLKVLSTFEGTMSSTELRWSRVTSPRTQWHETVLTSAPSVFPNTQPSSFILKYLGLTLYLTNLVMVSNCTDLLAAVRGASEARPAVVLTASVSLASCWPADGVAVPPVSSLYLMGLPDQPIRLDLAGREDALQLSSMTVLSMRFLTLTGLPTHLADHDADDEPSLSTSISSVGGDSQGSSTAVQSTTGASGTGATASSAASGAATYSPLDTTGDGGPQFPALATAFLWSFDFPRVVTQLQLEHVHLVLPEAELRQYDAMLNGSSVLPYFLKLRPFFQARAGVRTSADGNTTTVTDATAGSNNSSSTPAVAITGNNNSNTSSSAEPAQLWFANLLLPGMRVFNATLMSEAGAYPGWNESLYAAPAADPDGASGDSWPAWRIAVVTAVLGGAALLLAGGALLYAKARRARDGSPDEKASGRGGGKQRSSLDVETGGATRRGTNAGRCSGRRGSASGNPSNSGALVVAANNGRRGSAGTAGVAGAGVGNAELCVDGGGAGRGGGGAGGAAGGDGLERHPLYDSFDDPAFELDFLKGAKKLSVDDVADVLERINREAVEFNITMTEICGSGSFGVVYGGLWNGIKVAIKTMVFSEAAGGASQLAGQAARQQCIKEAAFCCTMHHANVVATHHFYLKSANRASMFDDLLQVVEKHLDSSSDDNVDDGRAYRAMRVPKGAVPQEEDNLLSMPPPRGAVLQPRTSSSELAEESAERSGADKAAPAPAQAEERQQQLVRGPGGLQLARTQPRRHQPTRPRRTEPKPAKPRPKPNVTDWRLYLVQEYCDGGTLRQAVDEGKLFRHGGSDRAPQTPSAGNSAALPHIPTAEAMRFAGVPAATRAAAGATGAAAAPALPASAGAASLMDLVQGRSRGSPMGTGIMDTGSGPGGANVGSTRTDQPNARLRSYLQPAASGAEVLVVGGAGGDGAAGGHGIVSSSGNRNGAGGAARDGLDALAAETDRVNERATLAAAGAAEVAVLLGSVAARRPHMPRPWLQKLTTGESASLDTFTNASESNLASADTAALNTTDSNLTVTGAATGASSSIFEAFVAAAAAAQQGNRPDASPPHTAQLAVMPSEAAPVTQDSSGGGGPARGSAAAADPQQRQQQHTITLSDVPSGAFCCPRQGSTERTGAQVVASANDMLLGPAVSCAPAAAVLPNATDNAASACAAADVAARDSSSRTQQQQQQQQQHQYSREQEDLLMRQERPLPADLALVVQTALGVASGVAYLHSRNIIHGDLSTNNVLLMRTPSPGLPVVAKVSDFGLSLRLSDGQDQIMNVRHGTPYYQSPEVAEHGTCSLAADVYSNKGAAGAGLAAQQARLLDPAGDMAQARAAAEAGGWDDPYYRLRACDVLKIAPHCPSAYARLVRRCLCPDPHERPTARSVVKALLRMERGIAVAQAVSGAMASASSLITGPPMGALMALSRPRVPPSGALSTGVSATARSALAAGASRSSLTAGGGGDGPNGVGPNHSALDGGGGGGRVDAAMLLEDFDAAAAAVAAAVAAVTARPAAAGASACAGAAALALAEYDDDALIAVGLEPSVVREARQHKQVPPSRRGSTLPHTSGLQRTTSAGSSEAYDPLDADAGAMAAATAAAAAVCGTEADMHVITRQPSQHRAAVAAAVAVAKAVASVTSTLSNNIPVPAPICASSTSNTFFGRSTTGIPALDTAMAAGAAVGMANITAVPLRRGATSRLLDQQPLTRGAPAQNRFAPMDL